MLEDYLLTKNTAETATFDSFTKPAYQIPTLTVLSVHNLTSGADLGFQGESDSWHCINS